jgi:hypothetical protein
VGQSRLEQPVERDRVPAMHVDHARILLQRIVRARFDPDDVAWIGSRLAKPHEVITQEGGLGDVEETARDDVALLLEGAPRTVVDHPGSRRVTIDAG